jgi:RNA polymerase sigma factor (TIGR02999 family)
VRCGRWWGVSESGQITRLLDQLAQAGPDGRSSVLDQLMPLIYGELKSLAHSNRYRWSLADAPGTTSLVHEAYFRIARQDHATFDNRHEFYALASRAMRSILVDSARYYRRLKRGGGAVHEPLEETVLVSAERSEELVALDEALERLESQEPRLARIVECRCFGGLTVEETASALGVSTATVKRGWSVARSWLYRELRTSST